MSSYLSREQVDHYHKEGYLHLEGVFSATDILNARHIFLTAFKNDLWKTAPHSDASIINDIYTYFPKLIHVFFNEKLASIIGDLIGSDIVLIPECSIHRNRYIHWHKDTSVQELNGEKSHRDYDAPLIQAAIYFQTNENGGGLTLIPGTHRHSDPYAKMLSPTLFTKAYYKLLKTLRLSSMDKAEGSKYKMNIPTQPGDLLLFDLRIDHRSTFAKTNHDKLDKLAIFNTFGNSNTVTKQYFDFMKNREEPYYKYFREHPLPEIVYSKGEDLGFKVWY